MGSQSISPDMRNEICEITLEEHRHHTNGNKVICLGFAAEDEHGDKDLLLHELLSVTPNNPQEIKVYNLLHSPSLIASRHGANSGQNDIVYFDHDTLEELELHQTGPLQRVADTKTVAVDWLSLCTQEKLKETLMAVYSRLRDIERIIVFVDNSSRRTMAREVQGMIRNQAFWQECNRRYALEQILPVRTRTLHVPQICLMRIARGCDHERDPRLPPQLTPSAHDLASPGPADIDELRDPAQQEEDPIFADYSLQDLLG
ncbi:hypothetical protein F5B21DRAFT_139783 [Xylaria acuta]|nr:hypothetical protein F5B21DRAFT_139783 [Xylaria acuta]